MPSVVQPAWQGSSGSGRSRRVRTWLTALALLTMAFAGCAASPPQEARPSAALLLGPESHLPTAPRSTASLDEPPAWRLGEWWHVSFSAPPYHLFAEVDAVVAGVEGGRYVVGMADHLDDGVILLHFPGFGEVDPDTLGFDAHDRFFTPLRFPLEAGKTWDTQWYTGGALTAKVDAVDAASGRATVSMSGVHTLHLVYDARMGAITELDIEGYGGFRLTAHGYGFQGPLVVPSHQDLVFCNGRSGAVQAVDFCSTKPATEPHTPTETLAVAGQYDRVSFGLFLRDTAEAAGPAAGSVSPAVLDIQVKAPDGTVYERRKTPDAPGMVLYAYGKERPVGTWQVTSVAGGEGTAILEGVAYRVVTTTLGGA